MEEFIFFYSKCYYLNNSAVVEKRIEELLSADTLTEQDVMLIIEWKLGRIDHKNSQAFDSICLRSKDEVEHYLTATRRGKIEAKKLCETISSKLLSLRKASPQDILNQLKNINTKNFGTVYLITLLYFITQGKCPIYDRFAMMALEAITQGKHPGAKIKYQDLPQKDASGFQHLLDADEQKSKYRKYINILETVFGKRYTANPKDRDIDRALWVYGHLFQQK